MKRILLSSCILAAFAAFPAAAAVNDAVAGAPAAPETLSVSLINNTNQNLGTARLITTPRGIFVQVDVQGLVTGWHGFHMYRVGDCSDPTVFQNAGMPIARPGEAHGFLNTDGPQQGDFPNIWVDKDGTGSAQFFNPFITSADLHKPLGASFIINGAEDDFKSDPAGQPGARVACGVIVPRQPPPAGVTTPDVEVPPPKVQN